MVFKNYLRLVISFFLFIIPLLILALVYLNFNRIKLRFSRAAGLINDSPVSRSVYLLIFNPVLESKGYQKLTTYANWNDPDTLNNYLINTFPTISHGYLTYYIKVRQEVDGYPTKSDNFIYTDDAYLSCMQNSANCHQPDIIDYQKLFTSYGVCSKDIDEVWIWGGPYFGFYEYNPVNYCGKTIFVMGFNYERGEDEAIHDFGHRMEFVGINRVGDGNWQQNEVNEWNKFSLINGHCGNIHWPPGTFADGIEYRYDKPESVISNCNGYINYPIGPFLSQAFNCNAWNCTQRGFVEWWLRHIPAATGTNTVNSKTIYNNWWKYYVYYDETADAFPTPTPAPGVFRLLSADLKYPDKATFFFDYTGSSNNYIINLSTTADMSWDVYLTFGEGVSSPIIVTNPTKWDKYTCGRTLYWRVITPTNVQSKINKAVVSCPYYLSFAPKGKPADSWNTAEKLLNYIYQSGVNPINISRMSNGQWNEIYERGLPAIYNDNFSIQEGEAYEIYFEGDPNLLFVQTLPYTDVYSQIYNLVASYNYISIPDKLTNSFGQPNSESLCRAINLQGGMVTAINRHDLTTNSNNWTKYLCGSNQNIFSISSGVGYLVQNSQSSTFTISTSRPQLAKQKNKYQRVYQPLSK